MTRAILVSADDWQGLYVNGELIVEDHNLDVPEDWVQWTNEFEIKKLENVYLHQDDIDKTYDVGSFPERLDEFLHKY